MASAGCTSSGSKRVVPATSPVTDVGGVSTATSASAVALRSTTAASSATTKTIAAVVSVPSAQVRDKRTQDIWTTSGG